MKKLFKINSRSFSNTTKELLSKKVKGFDEPTIWYKFSRLAQTTNSLNLGQGFPDWEPADFLIELLKDKFSSNKVNHQYTRSFGVIPLCESISRNYKQFFHRNINPLNEVLVSPGGVSLLYNTITGFVEPGDEVIVIEPFYESYLPEIIFSGGKAIGVPLIPPKKRNKSEYKALDINNTTKIKDTWGFDFAKFRNSLNEKTKMVILNTPNNPTGKILSYDEMKEIAKILEKFPKVVVLMDEVYEHMTYDEYDTLPRFANIPGMFERTISATTAGKTFSATGIRVAWAIGPSHLIKVASAVHQFNSFCMYEPIQLAVAEALDIANQPYKGFDSYFKWLRSHYNFKRHFFIQSLANLDNFDLDFFLPEGGYFVICDIKGKKVANEDLYFEGDEHSKGKYLRDFKYLLNMAEQKNVIGIPLSPFYTEQNRPLGQDFIRLAFCKKQETLIKSLENLNKKI
jgi:kynurenine--oxoglutarate transaminase/cysteine-S-conjugate beta-lyase/glutamine--phenylpyruvate transaminase